MHLFKNYEDQFQGAHFQKKKKNMKQFLSCDNFSPFYIYLNIFIKFTIHKRYRVHTLYIDTEHLISSFIYYKAIGMLVEALNIFNLCNKNFLRTHTHTCTFTKFE